MKKKIEYIDQRKSLSNKWESVISYRSEKKAKENMPKGHRILRRITYTRKNETNTIFEEIVKVKP